MSYSAGRSGLSNDAYPRRGWLGLKVSFRISQRLLALDRLGASSHPGIQSAFQPKLPNNLVTFITVELRSAILTRSNA